MASASQHPDYTDESQRLRDTIAAVQERLLEVERPKASGPVYRDAAIETARINRQEDADMRQALQEPYFARVDFKRDGADMPRPTYIGRFGIRSGRDSAPVEVHAWQAPVAQLYYGRIFGPASYRAPGGEICGFVSLRRNYKIRRGLLEDIIDEASVRSSREVVDAPGSAPLDDFLRDVLSDARDIKLRDIVATIQPSQYALIEAPADSLLIVQGVAGSGKTSVILHRIAYLLYHHTHDLAAQRMLVIGPNALFLDSISAVLPGLGVRDIKQLTFDAWALERIGVQIRYRATDATFEHLVDHAPSRTLDATERHLLNVATTYLTKVKGSMRMAALLVAHLNCLRRKFIAGARSVAVTYKPTQEAMMQRTAYSYVPQSASLSLSAEEVRAVLEHVVAEIRDGGGHSSGPNTSRDECVDRLLDALWDKFVEHPVYKRATRGDMITVTNREHTAFYRRQAFKTTLSGAVGKTIQEWWHNLTAVECYRSLLCDRTALAEAAATMTTASGQVVLEWELDLLWTPDAQRNGYIWTAEDLPCLCYLFELLLGKGEMQYDHVVVDEAQDLSPLQLWLLYRRTRRGSMTLAGDVTQSLAWRGIRDWSEFTCAVRDVEVRREMIAISYRSTYEITMFANRMLALARPGADKQIAAQPVSRHGPAPSLERCSSRAQRVRKVINIVSTATQGGSRSVAVICKTVALAEGIADELRSAGVSASLVRTRADHADASVVLLPVYLAKGVEYDTVVVPDADARTYADSEDDATLLYLAVTRALHAVHVFWLGRSSPLLPDQSELASSGS